jgi:hypothetical protein
MGKENIKKEPKDPSVENDRLENKDQKNVNKRPASQNDIGEHEFDEDRTTEIRMKPQPFKKEQPAPDRETDGL